MLYLASQSPQRSLLLAKASIPFEIVHSEGDEEDINLPHPQAMAVERARIKAEGAVISDYLADWQPEDAVLAADTVVSLGNEIFGKPADNEDAIRILTTLQGTTHIVTTAHCIWVPPRDDSPAIAACGVSFARVTMRPVSEGEIRDYVETGESANRSGAYAIQENADRFVVDREGPFDTIVGLHIASVRSLYYEATSMTLPGDESQEDAQA